MSGKGEKKQLAEEMKKAAELFREAVREEYGVVLGHGRDFFKDLDLVVDSEARSGLEPTEARQVALAVAACLGEELRAQLPGKWEWDLDERSGPVVLSIDGRRCLHVNALCEARLLALGVKLDIEEPRRQVYEAWVKARRDEVMSFAKYFEVCSEEAKARGAGE